MAVGFVANRTGVLPREGNKFLTNLLIKVIAPCMIFSSITSKELTDDTFAATLYTLLGAALFSVCAAVLGWVLCKYLLRVSPLEDVGVYATAKSQDFSKKKCYNVYICFLLSL